MKYQVEFQNFSQNTEIYKRNKSYWKHHVETIFDTQLESWVLETYANGDEILDANPLYSAKLPNNKAIRIIQDERNKVSPIFASWISNYKDNDDTVEELVIALQPYNEIYEKAIELISAYKYNKFKSLLNKLNRYYEHKTDCNRISYLKQFFDKTGLTKNHWNITRNHGKLQTLDIHLYKRINIVNENIQFYESRFADKELRRKYVSLINQLSKVNATITFNDNVDLSSIHSKHQYEKKILESTTMYHYCISYNSKVDKLEDRYKEFQKLVEEKHILRQLSHSDAKT